MALTLVEVRLKTGANIYVLSSNECDAVYKAYKKAVQKAELTPSNKGYLKFKNNVEGIKVCFAMELKEGFNLF